MHLNSVSIEWILCRLRLSLLDLFIL